MTASYRLPTMQAMLFRLYNQRVFELSEQKSVQQLSNGLEEELSNFGLGIITDNTHVMKIPADPLGQVLQSALEVLF
jgi:hypothetical protein